MASNGKVVIDIVANTSTLTPGLAQAEKTVSKFTTSAVQAGRSAASMTSGFNMARSGAAQFAVSLLGAKSAAASLATGLAMAFGATAGSLLAVTAGVGAIAFAYDKLTEKTRKAREETDKFIETQAHAALLRADPFADLRKGLSQAQARVAELRQQIATLQAANGRLIPEQLVDRQRIPAHRIDNTAEITQKQEELKTALLAVTNVQQQMKEKGDALVKSLQDQAAVFGKGDYAAQQYAITQKFLAREIDQTQAAMALAAAGELEMLRRKKDAHDKAAEAVKKHTDELEQLRQKMLATQHAWRVEAAGGGNQTAMAGGTPNLGDSNLLNAPVPSILQGADASGLRVEAAAQRARKALAEQTAIADEWKAAWRSAIEASAADFTNFFQRAFEEGQKLRDLLKSLLGSISSVFLTAATTQASQGLIKALGLAAPLVFHAGGLVGAGAPTRSVPAWLFAGAPRMHSGGLASDEVPAILQTGERVLSRREVAAGMGAATGGSGAVVHVHQTLHLNLNAMDGVTAADFLKTHSGTITEIVGRASREAPGFARYIAKKGRR